MERQKVKSSNIESIGYEEKDMILEIEFKSGGVYRYFNVSSGVYDTLMNADSHGRAFHKTIKGYYAYEKVV
ncbi:MAG: KTSC domain-containing protein [archaeon]